MASRSRSRAAACSRIRGDADDPFSRGHMCAKAPALADVHEDPDRLRRPVKRTDAGFVEISWEEAFELAAEGLLAARKQGGADAIALYRGNPSVHDLGSTLYYIVLQRAVGTRNRFSAGSLDTWPRYVQVSSMFGGMLHIPVPDLDRTSHLLVIGANPIVSNGSLMTAPDVRGRLKALRARGGKLVVIDPRRTETADLADEHHFIRPGADAALLLAMIRTLFDEDRVDLGRCGDFANGLERGAGARRSLHARARGAALRDRRGDHPPPGARARRGRGRGGLRADGHLLPALRHPCLLGDRSPQRAHGQSRPAGRGDVRPGGRSDRLRIRPGR